MDEFIQWVKSNWSKADLDGKSVQIDFASSKDRWIKGVGRFRVKENERRELSITVEIEGDPGSPSKVRHIHLNQSLANAMNRCPPASTHDFFLYVEPAIL